MDRTSDRASILDRTSDRTSEVPDRSAVSKPPAKRLRIDPQQERLAAAANCGKCGKKGHIAENYYSEKTYERCLKKGHTEEVSVYHTLIYVMGTIGPQMNIDR
ncbi:hypothetical protein LY78DRAFT_687557 [Colletotrichum sublineola]|nr:hypothetical protein LY78DRAFT_687557 [Colletotrichum sublineola]